MAEEKNNFEQELASLEKIVNNLESGNVPLADALDQFKAGVKLSRDLDKQLTAAEETVAKLIDKDGNETPIDPTNSGSPEA
ncbi:exodeoxyribonuclease VII small subunit [Lactobacillus corticis]|uniref:Exodeoxyribonuclease 7 small subunit n=1 Tax=Lactobacillus corticis TaxID=2201249 RepID=A0A916VH83_9LACO|nr:exodeoxyribonuclease VII small subunit [Lactobacillus corticis]GFZ26761.1 exodeoxyribonuclease VII small subunit [Lactobacillus corticis]